MLLRVQGPLNLFGDYQESQMDEPMSYQELLDRVKQARLRGNEELAKELFARALDLTNQLKGKRNSGEINYPKQFTNS